jgi:hypothetical protein
MAEYWAVISMPDEYQFCLYFTIFRLDFETFFHFVINGSEQDKIEMLW